MNTQRESIRDIAVGLIEKQLPESEKQMSKVIEVAKKETINTGKYHDNLLKVKEL